MTKKAVKAEVNSFIKGLITEASPLNFPENASIDEENFELLLNGTRQRRLGMDFEDNYIGYIGPLSNEDPSKVQIKSYVWRDVAGISGKDFVVIQTNTRFSLFELNHSSISGNGIKFSTTFDMTENGVRKASFTSVDGKLVIAYGSTEVTYISYITNTDSFTTGTYKITTRDIWGVEYPLAEDKTYYRPPQSADLRHFYNLYNQSWGVPRRYQGAGDSQFADPVGYFSSQLGVLPSNEETVWTAMSVQAGSNPYEYLRPNAWTELFGTTPTSAKGYFVIDLFERGASRTKAIEENKERFQQMFASTFATKLDYTQQGPTVVQEYSGRVFYGGFGGEVIDGDKRSPSLSSYIGFSRLVRNANDLGKCYQEGDPTSREGNDIVDTDGGLIRLSGLNRLVGMQDIGSALIAIGTNGVWAISGGSDYGFVATNYKALKISDYGAVSEDSIIKVGNTVMFWGFNSIYQVARNQTGDIVVTSISDNTIKQLYEEIPGTSKDSAVGIYDDISKTARWLYHDGSITGGTYVNELILDTRIPAFYKYKIYNTSVSFLRSMFQLPTYQLQDELVNLQTTTGELITTDTNEQVVTEIQTRLPSASGTRYVVLTQGELGLYYFTFAYYRNGEFRDWKSVDNVGIDAKAFIITGAITANDSSVNKQIPYVTVHMYRTENGVDNNFVPINQSGCFMRGYWGWSNSAASNKWSRPQQVYRYPRGFLVNSTTSYDTGFELVSTKNKLRGQGKSVSIYFETEPYKDCRLVGWNINVTGNSTT